MKLQRCSVPALAVFATLALLSCHKYNHMPGTPAVLFGPDSGYVRQTYAFSAAATDPDSDYVACRFDWGDGDTSDWSFACLATDTAWNSHAWAAPGTYHVRAQARDEHGKFSDWSAPHAVRVDTVPAGNSAPDVPAAPIGPATDTVGALVAFRTRSADREGDSIQYRFDWGDGNTSDWSGFLPSGDTVTAAHSWAAPGVYELRAQARDRDSALSAWSGPHELRVSRGSVPNQPPATPGMPVGPASGLVGSSYSYRAAALDPDGDSVACRFDWGDGDTSAWSAWRPGGESITAAHVWAHAGSYAVRAEARDVHGALSAWSPALSVAMDTGSSANQPPAAPAMPNGPASGAVGESLAYVTMSADPDGDSVECRFDWGDGDTSDWSTMHANYAGISARHAWQWPDTFLVRAQARDIQGALSRWSPARPVAVAAGAGYPHKVIATIPVGAGPFYLDVTPDGRFVYVANRDDGTVSVIRVADNTVVATVQVGGYPGGVVCLQDSQYVYVSSERGQTIWVIRVSDNTVVDSIATGYRPSGMDVLPDGEYVYSGTYGADYVAVIRTSDRSVVAQVTTGSSPRDVVVTPDGQYVYTGNMHGSTVACIRTADDTVVASIPVESGPRNVGISSDGQFVYVAYVGGYDLTVIRTSDNTVVKTVHFSHELTDEAGLPGSFYVYVNNWGSNIVSIVDSRTQTVVDSVTVGNGPDFMAPSPDGQRLFVTDQFDNTVSVISY